MNSKQRMLAALSNEQPDRVPIFEIIVDETAITSIANALGSAEDKADPKTMLRGEYGREVLDQYCFLVEELGLDATCSAFSRGMERIGDNRGRDKYGSYYALSEHGDAIVVEGPIGTLSDVKGYDMVSRLEPGDFSEVQYIIDRVGKDKAHFLVLNDPFDISWRLRGGMQSLLIDFIVNPELIHALARIATDFNIAVLDMARQIGADAAIVVGDLAGEETTIISPKHYRQYIKPYHRELVDCAHQQGLKIVKHTDGNAWLILDDFLEVGFDGFHPIQPQCMDIGEVKEHMAGKMCLLGNIDCRDLLPFGTEEEVEKVVKETIEKAAPGGGYIICSSNSIHPACRAENYIAMVRAAYKYGGYD